MKTFLLRNLAVALLAGSALAALPAFAGDKAGTDAGAKLMQQGDVSTGAAAKMDAEAAAKTDRVEGADADASADADVTAGADASTDEVLKPNEQSASEYAPGQKQKTDEVDSASDAAPGQMKKDGDVDTASEAAPGQMKKEEEVSSETTASIDISTEQKTEIREAIVETDIEPVEADFQVQLGVSIPSSIILHTLPPRVVEIVPVYEDYRYFVLADGRIVIVEPATLEIVYVLAV